MLYNKLVKKICQVIFRTIREVVIMFQVGDKIVHPMHGAGVIDSIVTKKVNGVVR